MERLPAVPRLRRRPIPRFSVTPHSLTHVPTGTATVIAYKAGYQSQTQSVTVEQAKVATLDFTLNTATTGIIKGTVKRSDTSRPLSNATVSTPVGMTNLTAITREDGTYMLTDVPTNQRSDTSGKAGFANSNAPSKSQPARSSSRTSTSHAAPPWRFGFRFRFVQRLTSARRALQG